MRLCTQNWGSPENHVWSKVLDVLFAFWVTVTRREGDICFGNTTLQFAAKTPYNCPILLHSCQGLLGFGGGFVHLDAVWE